MFPLICYQNHPDDYGKMINSRIVLDAWEGIFTYHPLIDSMSDFPTFTVAVNSPPLVFCKVGD
ncbi:MAG: hypothetical protein O4861_23145 [Trichodesmium sp. St16_bin4-tuft]|nr:hypothetical protein [Trichodesmium sp. St16_bin4-tuft]